MQKYNQKVGDFGEKLAEQYLLTKGYKILARKLKISYQEIDLIAKKQEQLVFVEVKTRTNENFGLVEDAFSQQKTSNLKLAINNYLENNNIYDENFRLDLIIIKIDKKNKVAKIKHFKNIF
jgi:putative endonuclease